MPSSTGSYHQQSYENIPLPSQFTQPEPPTRSRNEEVFKNLGFQTQRCLMEKTIAPQGPPLKQYASTRALQSHITESY